MHGDRSGNDIQICKGSMNLKNKEIAVLVTNQGDKGKKNKRCGQGVALG
jgi:hypothetical protein